MAHVEELLGTPLVRSAKASSAFSKRDLGQLGSMARELSRDTPARSHSNVQLEYGQLVALLMQELKLDLRQAALATAIEQRTLEKWMSGDTPSPNRAERIRIVAQLIATAQEIEAGEEPPGDASY